jgi:MinD superfamily P-loop ATPase
MWIAIASGKGGTGKTTVAVNLTAVCKLPVTILDCDVEEPNVHLFIKPTITKTRRVSVKIPAVDMDLCTSCGACREACRFNAVILIKGKPLFLKELCHSCGACIYACQEDALTEIDREIGTVEEGTWNHGVFARGLLDIGEARSEPLIHAVREIGNVRTGEELVVIDVPPGTSCPVIAAVKDVDYLLLVTEPTPFGLHDLTLAVKMGQALNLPLGVLINRSDIGDSSVRDYCASENVPVLGEFPFDRRIAVAYSRGDIASDVLPDVHKMYVELLHRLMEVAKSGVGA